MRVSEETKELQQKKIMKRDNVRTVEHSLLCRPIRKRLKENLEDYNQRWWVTAAEAKQSLTKYSKSCYYIVLQ